jgi:chromosome segregation ATPase
MIRVFAVTVLIIVASGISGYSQSVLETIENILNSIDSLKSQVETIGNEIGEQAQQLTSLDETLEKINAQWPEIQQSAQLVENLRIQIEPILEKWPDMESAFSTFDGVAGELSKIKDGFGNLESRIEGFLQTSNDDRFAKLESDYSEMKIAYTQIGNQANQLEKSVDSMQLSIYVLFGLVLILVVVGVILFRRLSTLN